MIYRSLMRWKRKTTLSEATLRSVKPELREKVSQLYIHRSVQGGDIFVDIYWYIKRNKNTPHEDYIYYRCNWTKAKQVIAKVEKTELPARITKFLKPTEG